MADPKRYSETRKVKKGSRTSTVESHWSGPEEMPKGKLRPGHFSKDPKEDKEE